MDDSSVLRKGVDGEVVVEALGLMGRCWGEGRCAAEAVVTPELLGASLDPDCLPVLDAGKSLSSSNSPSKLNDIFMVNRSRYAQSRIVEKC